MWNCFLTFTSAWHSLTLRQICSSSFIEGMMDSCLECFSLVNNHYLRMTDFTLFKNAIITAPEKMGSSNCLSHFWCFRLTNTHMHQTSKLPKFLLLQGWLYILSLKLFSTFSFSILSYIFCLKADCDLSHFRNYQRPGTFYYVLTVKPLEGCTFFSPWLFLLLDCLFFHFSFLVNEPFVLSQHIYLILF